MSQSETLGYIEPVGKSAAKRVMARERSWRQILDALPFLIPGGVIFVGLILYPIVYAVVMSFYRWDGAGSDRTFIGIQNYVDLFTRDPIFGRALLNSFIWVVLSLFIPTLWGLTLALLLNRKMWGRALFRTAFYLPAVISSIAVSTIWSWMYNPFLGFINAVMKELGLNDYIQQWLGDPQVALYAVFAAYVWVATGPNMLLFLAGLQNVPQDLVEAARVDGARPLQVFRFVTIPSLRPAIIVVIALTIINSLKVFDLVYQMTFGGPAQSTQVLATWTYFQAFSMHNFGMGMAVAVVLLVITLIIIIPYLRWATRGDDK